MAAAADDTSLVRATSPAAALTFWRLPTHVTSGTKAEEQAQSSAGKESWHSVADADHDHGLDLGLGGEVGPGADDLESELRKVRARPSASRAVNGAKKKRCRIASVALGVVLAWLGVGWRGLMGRGVAWHGVVWLGVARHPVLRGLVRLGVLVWFAIARCGVA